MRWSMPTTPIPRGTKGKPCTASRRMLTRTAARDATKAASPRADQDREGLRLTPRVQSKPQEASRGPVRDWARVAVMVVSWLAAQVAPAAVA
jgi:hypothetical protein